MMKMPPDMAPVLLGFERRRCGLNSRRLRVGEVDYVYSEGGRGEPLLLVHGIGADRDHFTRTARWLTPHFHVIAVDLPGFGESTRLPIEAGYSIAEQMQRLRGFVQALGLGRLHLGGSSMGGWIVSEYALAHPDEVESLWLLAPAGVEAAAPSDMLRAFRAEGRSPLFADSAAALERTLDFVFERRPYLPGIVRRALLRRAMLDHDLHQQIFQAIHDSMPLDGRIDRLGTRAQIVWGEKDRVLDVSGAHILHGLLPNSELRVIPRLGHLPMAERPRGAARDYLRFRGILPRR